MSQSREKGMAQAGCDYVGQEQIWKDHIGHEKMSAQNWETNWKFMTANYKDFVEAEFPEHEKKQIPIPKHLRIAPTYDIHECVEAFPSTKPVPKTTSSEIGWRSSEYHLRLDKYGSYCPPKSSILKQLKWPKEAVG